MRPVSVGNATASGISWTMSAQAMTQLLGIMRLIVLARLLSPAEFGLFAIVGVALVLATVVSEFGIGAALVQSVRLDGPYLDTAFWLQSGLAALSGLSLAASGPAIAYVFDQPALRGYCLAMGIAVAGSTWGTVHRAILDREMRFRFVATRDAVATLIGTVVAIAIGVVRHDAWALVLGAITTLTISNLAAVGAVHWWPRLRFSTSDARAICGFSARLLGVQALSIVVRNGDNLLIGRFLGVAELGLYSRAYQFLLVPIRQVSQVIGRVMFPALSALQGSVERSRSAYLRVIGGISLVTFPILAGVIVTAADLVRVVLGEQWMPAVPMVRVFALAGILESITATTSWIYQARGKTAPMLRMALFYAIVVLSGVGVGVWIGTPLAVALMFLVSLLLVAFPAMAVPFRLIELPVSTVGREVAPTFGCAMLMTATVAGARELMNATAPGPRLAVAFTLGITVYVAAAWAFRLRALGDLRHVVQRRRSAARHP